MSAGAIALPRHRERGSIIAWAFGVATVLTSKGKAMFVDRLKATPSTYTNSPKFLAMGTGATGAAREAKATDTALSTEVETRTSGTESNATANIWQLAGTQTATAERKVDEAAIFDASTVGNMFASATMNVDTLASGDAITWTWRVELP